MSKTNPIPRSKALAVHQWPCDGVARFKVPGVIQPATYSQAWRYIFEKAGGIEELAKQHLGDWWKEARNLMYMRTLLVEVERQGAAAGVWENPEEEEGDEEDAETVEEAPPPGEDA